MDEIPKEFTTVLRAISTHLKEIGKLPSHNEVICASVELDGSVTVDIKPRDFIFDVKFERDIFTPGNKPVMSKNRSRGLLYNAWQYVRQGLGLEVTDPMDSKQVMSVMEPVSGKVIHKTDDIKGKLQMQFASDTTVHVMVLAEDGTMHVSHASEWEVV